MLEPSIDQPRTRGQQRWRQRLRHYVRYAATCGWRTPPRAAASAPRPRSRHRRPPPSRRKRGRTRCRRRRHAATASAAAPAGRRLVIYSKIPCPLRLSPNPFSIAFLLLVIFSSDVWPHYVACAPPPHLRHHSNRVRTDSPDDGHHKAGHRDLSSQPYQYRDHQPPQQQQLHLQLPVQPQRAHRSRDHRHSQYHGGGGGGGGVGDDDDDSRVSRPPQFHYDIGVTFLNQPSPHSKSQSQSQSHPHPGSSRPPCGPGIWVRTRFVNILPTLPTLRTATARKMSTKFRARSSYVPHVRREPKPVQSGRAVGQSESRPVQWPRPVRKPYRRDTTRRSSRAEAKRVRIPYSAA